MKAELIALEGENDTTIWCIKFSENEHILNDLFDSNIQDCEWIDEGHTICRLNYNEWDSSEHIAIISRNGQIIRNGIDSIEQVLEDLGLLIVIISGFGLGEQSAYYQLEENDSKWAVINSNGSFIIDPEYDYIEFNEEENTFTADEIKYSVNGDVI